MPAHAQPTTLPAMDLYHPLDQKQEQHEQCEHQHDQHDHPCIHAHARSRAPLHAHTCAAFIALALLLAAACALAYTYLGPESAAFLGEGLFKRDPDTNAHWWTVNVRLIDMQYGSHG
ncbi:hypothetical protein BD779DRAFT_1676842 [Infundibulicybe gibba]|nr:hypothetical protein BD779DRAFT_1676842 [Infundibulicybe gibba]